MYMQMKNTTQAEVDATVKALQDAKKAPNEKSNNGNGGNNNNDVNTGNGWKYRKRQSKWKQQKPQNTANKGAQTDQQPVTMYLVPDCNLSNRSGVIYKKRKEVS